MCSFVSDVSLGRSFSAVHMGAVIVPGILNSSHHVRICNIILAAHYIALHTYTEIEQHIAAGILPKNMSIKLLNPCCTLPL